MRLQGKHIVLGICGGIAAYKSAFLLRLLIKEGAEVQVVMTPAGKEFITPVTLSSLSGKPVVSEFFTANTGEWHSHVDLGLWADLMVIAPATANTLAKMASGIADNMLLTTYLSAKEPVMVAPAMDLDMYAHPATRRNLLTLEEDGVIVLDSPAGELASGLTGKGRMLEPEEILERIVDFFTHQKRSGDFEGKKVIVTAGPTHERIDPVRFIGNYSSGKMGFAIAQELASRSADVTVVCGPVHSIPDFKGKVSLVDVTTALEMFGEVEKRYSDCDIAVFVAAVADYRPEKMSETKIKREHEEKMNILLIENPDIAAEMGKRKRPGQINVGFALETDHGIENASGKLTKKNLDMIVLNPANDKDAGLNADNNRITILRRDESRARELQKMSKKECAVCIADAILDIIR